MEDPFYEMFYVCVTDNMAYPLKVIITDAIALCPRVRELY